MIAVLHNSNGIRDSAGDGGGAGSDEEDNYKTEVRRECKTPFCPQSHGALYSDLKLLHSAGLVHPDLLCSYFTPHGLAINSTVVLHTREPSVSAGQL